MKTNSLTLMLVPLFLVQVATSVGTLGSPLVIGITKKGEDALLWYAKDKVFEGCLIKKTDYPVPVNNVVKIKFTTKGEPPFIAEFGVPTFDDLDKKDGVAIPTGGKDKFEGIKDYCVKQTGNEFKDSVRRQVRMAL